MKIFSIIFVFSLLAPYTWANEEKSFEGVFHKSSGQYYFRDNETRRLLRMVPRDQFVRQDLAKLDSGDTLLGSGYINEDNSTLQLSSVHFVGLSKMLGVWRLKTTNALFEFINFSTMTVYQQQDADQEIRKNHGNYQPIKSYQYSVAPNTAEKWSILISDESSVNTGRLEVTNTTIEINLIDPQTGQVVNTLTLRRIY